MVLRFLTGTVCADVILAIDFPAAADEVLVFVSFNDVATQVTFRENFSLLSHISHTDHACQIVAFIASHAADERFLALVAAWAQVVFAFVGVACVTAANLSPILSAKVAVVANTLVIWFFSETLMEQVPIVACNAFLDLQSR